MNEFKDPRQAKTNRRRAVKLNRLAAREAGRVRTFVESLGGEKAFRARMEALTARFGGRYGLPPLARGKTFSQNRYLETEVGMRGLTPVSNAVLANNGLLLMPGGFATATVPIPKSFRKAFRISPCSTSTFARCGVNILEDQRNLQRQLSRDQLPPTMQVRIHSWSSVPVMLREGDPCRILNTAELVSRATNPRTRSIQNQVRIQAGDEIIRVNRGALPVVNISGEAVRYVDPHAPNFNDQFEVEKFKKLKVKPGDFLVVLSKQRARVPVGHVAWVHAARDDLMHTSARLIHPGSRGKIALEFLATRQATLKPGHHVASFTLHPIDSKTVYTGRYQEQETAAPKKKKR